MNTLMNFEWEKRGLIFDPSNRFDWMNAYSQVPVPIDLDQVIRIFFTCRPIADSKGQQISHIASIDLDKNNFSSLINISKEPVLPLGKAGDFDEHGIHPCGIIKHQGEIWLYFQGWERSVGVPYKTSLGLAISKDGGNTFKKFSTGPIMSRTPNEPYLENGFFVFKDKETFRMIYATCNRWVNINGRLEPVYFLTTAESTDGINWVRHGNPIISKKYEVEASGRPTLSYFDGMYHLWFCFRNVESFRGNTDGAYQIGYAYSTDFKNWIRDDRKSGINLSAEGWDSKMQAYPYVIDVQNRKYLFYNGNEFGKYGIGYAELVYS